MSTDSEGMAGGGRLRWMRLVKVAVTIVLAFAVIRVGPIWLLTLAQQWVPRWVTRAAAIGFLETFRAVYLLALLVVLLGGTLAVARLVRSRRSGGFDRSAARVLVLSVSLLFGFLLTEGAAAAWTAWSHRLPDLPTTFDPPSATDRRNLYIVVVGESSARGTPYDPWLSVAQIAAWQIERVFPGRKVDVHIEAAGGLCLEQAVITLSNLRRRPDAILIYSGHNEFQARYGWSRNVRYYLDEKPRGRTLLVAWTRRFSPLCSLIEDTIDKHRVDEPPPKGTHRELIDHPSFTPEEYAYLRWDFHRRLDGVVRYCERIGALPILIAPAGNDGDYPPDRSCLRPEVTQPERERAAQRFREARAAQSTDRTRAMQLYRDLLREHPTFAEAHYRLAQMLEEDGDYTQANEHYVKARDCDGLPMRCPTDFLAAYHDVARRHKSVVFVDGLEVIPPMAPHGILESHVIHDGQHPTFRSYIALTQKLLDTLRERHAFGWPENVPTPVIDPDDCARHFEMDAKKWSFVCRHTAMFYARTSELRYDPHEHLSRVDGLLEAARQIEAGKRPEDVGITGLGVHPAGLKD